MPQKLLLWNKISELYILQALPAGISYTLLKNYSPRALYIRQWPYSAKHIFTVIDKYMASACFSLSLPLARFYKSLFNIYGTLPGR